MLNKTSIAIQGELMKHLLLTGVIATTMSFAPILNADFTFHSSEPNACEHIPGHWVGTGQATNWFIGTCVYHGSGSTSALDSTGHFTMEVTAKKDSGNYLCPNEAAKQLHGVCINGVVTIMTEYGELAGNFSENNGDAGGTLAVGPGMSADIAIQFHRIG